MRLVIMHLLKGVAAQSLKMWVLSRLTATARRRPVTMRTGVDARGSRFVASVLETLWQMLIRVSFSSKDLVPTIEG
jgi:hypothetical protein